MRESESSNLIHNERIKYAATFWNNLAIASFAGGCIIPLFSTDEKVQDARFIFIAGGSLLALMLRVFNRAARIEHVL
ncbi:MAG: hypothetical protein JWP25_6646 [Bradyrhizobium sp.]|nr:hypothetical protein [Bradyrhizobium sp.]